jgi:hypothetical protein
VDWDAHQQENLEDKDISEFEEQEDGRIRVVGTGEKEYSVDRG